MKVIIIGGGIGGLTLARACLDLGLAVEVYEKRSLETMLSGPGGIFIQRNAMRVYEVLQGGNIRDRCYATGGAIQEGGFFSRQGEILYASSPRAIQEPDLGLCLLRPDLQRILYEALPPGTVQTDCAFDSFEPEGETVRVTFQTGQTTVGDVLVGADGLYSGVRARLQGVERLPAPLYSGMCCWRGYFDAAGLALDDRYSWAELWGQGDRFGYFHVGGSRWSFYGFTNALPGGDDTAEGGPIPTLRSRFGNYAAPVPAILEALAQQDQPIYRDDVYDREPLGSVWGQGRVTLIGDAAHPVQPNLGQGGCMAIEDAFELAKYLATAAPGSVAATLRAFEASRSDRVTKVFQSSRQVGQLGQASHPVACFLRNWLYKLLPTWLADWQFKWLADYRPVWPAGFEPVPQTEK